MTLPASAISQSLQDPFAQEESMRKQAIARRFGEAAKVYDEKAQVQKQVSKVGLDILRRWSFKNLKHPETIHALDIGCGTGFDTHHLLELADRVTGADLSPGMIEWAREKHADFPVSWLVADAENMPFEQGEIDVLFSSMALQWLADPRPAAQECFRVMSKGAGGVIAVVLQDSLYELHNSWLTVTDKPPVNTFFHANKWLIAFKNAGFSCRIHTQDFVSWHQDVFAVLHSIKDVGAGVVLAGSKPNLLKKTNLKLLNKAYKAAYSAKCQGRGLPLTWKIGFLIFDKP